MRLTTAGYGTHTVGRYRATSGFTARCGVAIDDGWVAIETNEAPTCEKCRALATHDSGGKVPWWES